ncbi:ketoacyl-synt-domain-containing protein [Xylariaceae sp. FL0255]|nr:ketoacyl-synt-domain-containing protein [Xylariaceae sp. FL0255]
MVDQPSLEPIAICGMACRLPAAIDSPSSLWRMLVEKKDGRTARVPPSRFNIDAHFHSDRDRPGSFNVAGGYFLDGNPFDFDASFFNITPIEAQWLDPQQRRILEVSYECLESAGLRLDQVAGSNTGVFVGSFTSDYQQMSIGETDFRHSYAATGVDPGIISNRIGNVFDLNGPSFTINTACSSSVYALHNACNALRAKDCDAAIVGGVNLILTVDQHMNTAKLGVLSPTSTCHTFDEKANGYGRAEGAGAFYVKRLSDALRDGNPIRGVIRGSAVNTNGKVEGLGITHPCGLGQERVVRLAYEKAGLDPRHTIYAELHGTGTPVGDPIEVRAISRAMNDSRPSEEPLLIGAIKPNIGHSEAASGIFAVMKAVMMTEAAIIPGVAFFNRLNPEIKDKEWNTKVHAETTLWPQKSGLRRASVSSFGYGGTNGHIIVESVNNLVPSYQHAVRKIHAVTSHSTNRPLLLCFSAHDKPTLSRNLRVIQSVAADYYPTDLTHTLNLHRTRLSHRAFTIIRDGQEQEAFAPEKIQTGVASSSKHRVGFLFTGQGAQWIGMGQVAASRYPSFLKTIEKLDQVLSRLTPRPTFTLKKMLSEDADASKINEAEVTQPLCTAIQVALVDLFSMWQITPAMSIGHSSGEIAAAYAAGLISAPEAILIAFMRGRAVAETAGPGSMLAVGLGSTEVEKRLPSDPKEICIACENSPGSVTLSGEAHAITALAHTLKAEGIFAQELSTGRAYHSPHMNAVGDIYDALLPQHLATLEDVDLSWRNPRSSMISSVTGDLIVGESIHPTYWSSNLRERVVFETAMRRLGSEKAFEDVTSIVEVGCHSALARPFKQAKLANKTYIPSMSRDRDDMEQLLQTAGSLFLAGYPVDLEAVNRDFSDSIGITQIPSIQKLLVDLPPYQWNYDKTCWAEPRISTERRLQAYLRHDLLGTRVAGLSNSCRVWRNILRHRDVPWLKDHTLGEEAVFPAAGYLTCAIEALRQVFETEHRPLYGIEIRDVNIKDALVIPQGEGIEVILCLHTTTNTEYTFTLESIASGVWTLHCEGHITAGFSSCLSREHPVDELELTQRVSGKRWYDSFHRVGFRYTDAFQQLLEARTEKTLHKAAGDVIITQKSGVMLDESRYVLHPSTIDACLQLIIISVHAGKHKDMPWGVVPTRIRKFSLTFSAVLDGPGHAVAWTDRGESRHFNTHTCLIDSAGNMIMDIQDLECVAYEAVVPPDSFVASGNLEPFSVVTWKPDITGHSNLTAKLEYVEDVVELVCHKKAVRTALICGKPSSSTMQSILDALSPDCAVTVGFAGDEKPSLDVEDFEGRLITQTLSISPAAWQAELKGSRFDLLLCDYSGNLQKADALLEEADLASLLSEGGWVVGPRTCFSSLPNATVEFGQHIAYSKHETAPSSRDIDEIVVLTPQSHIADLTSIVQGLASCGRTAKQTDFVKFVPEEGQCAIIDDRSGSMLLSLTEQSFISLKSLLMSGTPLLWLTRGVYEGRCAEGGMAEGFLRVIRSENVAARIILLDVDCDEGVVTVAQAALTGLEALMAQNLCRDSELWLHRGIIHTPRLYPHPLEQLEEACETHEIQDQGSSIMSAALSTTHEFTPSVSSRDEYESSASSVTEFTPESVDGGQEFSLLLGEQLKSDKLFGPTLPTTNELNPPTPTGVTLSAEGTYLLVGCLGGIGRSLTKWMMEHGARHFAFISRSGASKPEATRVIADIEKCEDTSTRVYRVDASDEMAMQCIVYSLQAERPIKGVVHAAMVLRDGMFDQMSFTDFQAAITPKVRGAQSLHNALRSADLDFFIMTSSVSAVLGNTGQSNYSAANSFLDALAVQRRASGLAGTSLALPMVIDVGVVAEDDAIEMSLTRKGLYGISEDEMLRGFEMAMAPFAPAHIVMGVEACELARTVMSTTGGCSSAWMDNSLFEHVRTAVEADITRRSDCSNCNNNRVKVQEKGFLAALEAARASGEDGPVLAIIAAHIARRMSEILMIPEENFDLNGRSLGSYGLDSMVGTEMRTWLFKEFGLDYSFRKLLASTLTFTVLARVVAEKMGILTKIDDGNSGS